METPKIRIPAAAIAQVNAIAREICTELDDAVWEIIDRNIGEMNIAHEDDAVLDELQERALRTLSELLMTAIQKEFLG